ncbi:MAG: PTS sugar transporter subunit IIA [Fidelibacterota bacterium]|nr:MAG: PTS sugar transporter subunit IIA [Candidatus Neomarinimicrobiota bacterium]
MRATDRSSAVQELLTPLEEQHIIDSSQECLESILKRERRMSTGVGKGIALPHGLSKSVKEVALVMGISPDGIDFKAVDGALCHIFILLLSPEQQPDKHLKLLGRITKLLSDGSLRSALVETSTPGEVLEILRKWETEGEDAPI